MPVSRQRKKTKKQPQKMVFNQDDFISFHLNLFYEYMKARADYEKVDFALTLENIYEIFEEGMRKNNNSGFNFFGVELNKLAFPLWDDQEPYKGFLNTFICWYNLPLGEK